MLFFQALVNAQLARILPMELVNVVVIAVSAVWILEGLDIELVKPSVEFDAISNRILLAQLIVIFAPIIWSAVLQYPHLT
jgi:hypothetical protein